MAKVEYDLSSSGGIMAVRCFPIERFLLVYSRGKIYPTFCVCFRKFKPSSVPKEKRSSQRWQKRKAIHTTNGRDADTIGTIAMPARKGAISFAVTDVRRVFILVASEFLIFTINTFHDFFEQIKYCIECFRYS